MTERNGDASENYYISIADDTGVLRLMQLPKHLWISSDQAVRSVELKLYFLNYVEMFAVYIGFATNCLQY